MPSKQTRFGLLLTILLASVGILYHHLPRNAAEVSVGINLPATSTHCDGLKSKTDCEELYGCFYTTECLYIHKTGNFAKVKEHIRAGTEYFDSAWLTGIINTEKAKTWYQRSIIFTGIQGFSCAEGGSAGQSRDWAAMWGVFKVWAETATTKTLAAFVGGTAIGSSSGGAWFVSDLLFSPPVQATFAEGQTTENLKAAAVGRQKWIQDAVWVVHEVNGGVEIQPPSKVYDVVPGAKEFMALQKRAAAAYPQEEMDGLWEDFMHSAHEDYGDTGTPTPVDAHWYQSTLIPLENCVYKEPDQPQKPIYLAGLNHGGAHSRAIPVLIKVTSPVAVTAFLPALEGIETGATNDLVQTARTQLKLGTSSSDPKSKPVTYNDIKAAIENWPKNALDKINTKVLSAPTSDFPGFVSFANTIVRKFSLTAMDVAALVVKTKRVGDADVGLCMGDSGISDPAGLAGAIKGMQERLTPASPQAPQAALQKVAIFINGGTKEWSIYIAESPTLPQMVAAKPWPKIFASKHQMGPTIELSTEVKLTTILVETIENKEWGIKGGYFYEIIAFDINVDFPILPPRGADLTTEYAVKMERIANAIVNFPPSNLESKLGISTWRENWVDIILLASIITSAVLLWMVTSADKQLQYSLLDENCEEV